MARSPGQLFLLSAIVKVPGRREEGAGGSASAAGHLVIVKNGSADKESRTISEAVSVTNPRAAMGRAAAAAITNFTN